MSLGPTESIVSRGQMQTGEMNPIRSVANIQCLVSKSSSVFSASVHFARVVSLSVESLLDVVKASSGRGKFEYIKCSYLEPH